MDAVREQTKLEVLNYVILRPTGWSSQWVLTAVIDASGETWWCMKVGGEGTLIDHAQQISMEKIGPIPQISRATLASIDRIAAQQIEYHVSSTDFERRGVQCSMRAEFAAADSPDAHMNSDFPIAAPALRGWSLYVRTSDLLRVKAGESLWLDPYIRVIVQGFTSGSQKVSHIASGKMDESVASDLQKLMSASPQGDFVFFENGNFAIHLKSLFGEPIADELGARLRDLDRLRSFAAILQKRKMKLRKSSLQQVQFQYGNGETATVDFGQKDNIQVSFSPGNPHNRIARRLVELINNRPPFNTSGTKSGLERFCETLVYTRPILAALLELENAAPGNIQNPAVFAHNFSQYRITYANPLCSFDIRLRRKEDAFVWHIEDNDKKEKDLKPGVELDPNHKRSDALKTALSTLFKRTKQPGQRWMGTHTGILAPLDAIPDALKELHQTVISCAIEGGYKAPTENVKSEGASTEAKSEAGKPPAPSAGAQGRSQGNANANAKTRLNFPNAGRGPQGLKQEVIELDD
jgi:mediator of RNA polymerase II transcription subunit 14